jgi:multidrug efflux pump subunit AcrB
LLALGLAVGIVVDDAIMVLENIVRHSESGKDRVRAAREGTREITFAALSATLAVIAIFIPVIFMEGVVGRFFLQFGVTLSIAVALSYLEAITLAPARCAQMLSTSREHRGRVGRAVDRGFAALERIYEVLLRKGLQWPGAILLVAVGVLIAAGFGFKALPAEFVPSQDQSQLMIRLQTAVGSDLFETDGLMKKAEAVVTPRADVKRAFVVIGGFGGAGVNTGIMFVTLVPPEERPQSQAEVAGELRKQLNQIPGLRAVVQDLSQSGFTAQRGFPVEFSVRGPDWEGLVSAATQLKTELAASGTVIDLDTDYQLGMPELRIVPGPGARRGPGRADRGGRHHAQRAGRRRKASANTPPAGAGSTCACACSPPSGAAPKTLAAAQGAHARRDAHAVVGAGDHRRAAGAAGHHRRDRERAITVFANVAPGHSQDEALKPWWRRSARACRTAIARCWAGLAWPSASPRPA